MVNFFLFLHVLGVVVWVGGMFFAYTALRPAATEVLEAPERLPLWTATLRRFFSWVWVAVALLLVSGFSMMWLLGGFRATGVYVHVMLGIGILMMLIFAHVFFAAYNRLKRYASAREWKAAGAALAQIRMLVGVNLVLGLVNIAVATLGR